MPSKSSNIKKKSSPSKIAEFREAMGLTQQELGAFVGVTTNTVQNWESGKSGLDQIRKFLRLCAILGCDLADLIDDPELKQTKGFSLDQLRQMRQQWLEAAEESFTDS